MNSATQLIQDGFIAINLSLDIEYLKNEFLEILYNAKPNKVADDRDSLVKISEDERAFYYINDIKETNLNEKLKKNLKDLESFCSKLHQDILSEIGKIEQREEYFNKLNDASRLSLIRAIFYPKTKENKELTKMH